MQIPVVVEPVAGNGFRARGGEPFALTADGPTPDQAVQNLQALIAERMGATGSQIVLLDIESIMSTCGFAVPRYEYQGERDNLLEFACKMGDEKMDAYRHERNERSIDGLPTYLFEDKAKE